MSAIDFSKPVQTRDGRKVRVLCTDASMMDNAERLANQMLRIAQAKDGDTVVVDGDVQYVTNQWRSLVKSCRRFAPGATTAQLTPHIIAGINKFLQPGVRSL